MQASIRRAALIMTLGFVALMCGLVYWQVVRSQSLDEAASNPRVAEASRHERRGSIYDANGQMLAHSVPQPDGSEKRVYSLASLAQTIGYVSTQFGVAGLEASYNGYLSGQQGGGPLAAIVNDVTRQPQPGNDLVLTIDSSLQQIAANALGDRKGAVVALDPHTGAVKAMVSSPSYDPNQFDANSANLLTDPNDPLLNRATQGLYPPGSTYKTVTATAALDGGVVKPTDMYQCVDHIDVHGFPIACTNAPPGQTQWDVETAYAWSINATFAQIALQVGAARFTDYSERFGVGQALPFDIETAKTSLYHPGHSFSDPVLLASSGFGQGELEITPLQMALIAATVANNGVEPAPYLVAEVRDPSGNVVEQHQPETRGQVMRPDTARTMQQFMLGPIKIYGAESGMTGLDIAGKTGTAETGQGGQSHAWFTGYAPTGDPRLVVAVIVENGGAGSVTAGPIATQVLKTVLGQ